MGGAGSRAIRQVRRGGGMTPQNSRAPCREGAGTDVAVDDAECAQCGGNRKPVGVCRFTWVSISHCFPRSAFVAAQSASGRRELLEAQCLVICVGLLIPLCDAIRTRNQSEEVTRPTMVTPFGNATATLEQRVLFQHGLMTEFHPPMAAKNL
jgi:hypothetical protein